MIWLIDLSNCDFSFTNHFVRPILEYLLLNENLIFTAHNYTIRPKGYWGSNYAQIFIKSVITNAIDK